MLDLFKIVTQEIFSLPSAENKEDEEKPVYFAGCEKLIVHCGNCPDQNDCVWKGTKHK
jgi:hypothetical protein